MAADQTKKEQAEKHTTCDENGDCIPSGVNLVSKKDTYFFDDEWNFLTATQRNNYVQPTMLVSANDKLAGILWGNQPLEMLLDNRATVNQNVYDLFADPIRTSFGALWWMPSGESPPKFIRQAGASRLKNVFPFHKFEFKSSNYTHEYMEMPTTLSSKHIEVFNINYQDHYLPQATNGGAYDESLKIMERLGDDDSPNKFADYTTKISLPYTYAELENYNFLTTPLYVKTDSRYNFHIPEYERITSQRDGAPAQFALTAERQSESLETLLPDIYTQAFDRLTGDKIEEIQGGASVVTNIRNMYDMHSTLSNLVPDVFKDTVSKEGKLLKSDSKGNYFRKWSKNMSELLLMEDSSIGMNDPRRLRTLQLLDAYKRQVFPATSVKTMNEFNDRKYLFPMYNEIEFSTDTNTLVTDLLTEMRLDYAVLKIIAQGINGDLVNHPEEGKRGNINFAHDGTGPMDRIFLADESGVTLYGGTTNATLPHINEQPERMHSFRFLSPGAGKGFLTEYWWHGADAYSSNILPIQTQIGNEQFSINDKIIPYSDHAVMIDAYPEPTEISLTNPKNISNKFLTTIMSTIFRKRFLKILKEKTRNYKDIVEGKTAYSETFCYAIEKWSATNEGEPRELLQTTLLQNSNDIDVMKYVDTQIVYGKKYIYRIKAWQVVFGSQIKYDSVVNHPVIEASPPPPDQPTELSDPDWFKVDLYRAAAELLGADMAQRMWLYKRGNSQPMGPGILEWAGANNDYIVPGYNPIYGDVDVINNVSCGVANEWYYDSGFASMDCRNDAESLTDAVKYSESLGAMKDGNCCSHLHSFKSPGVFGYWKNMFSKPMGATTDTISTLLAFAEPVEMDSQEGTNETPTTTVNYNPVPLPADMKEGFFEHRYKTMYNSPLLKNQYPDGVKDIRTWFSATLLSIVSRRARFILDNSLLIGREAIHAKQESDLGDKFPWWKNSSGVDREKPIYKIFGKEQGALFHVKNDMGMPTTNRGVFMENIFTESGFGAREELWDASATVGTYNRWNNIRLDEAVYFLKTLRFSKLRDGDQGEMLESVYSGYQYEADRMEEMFQNRLNVFLLELEKYIKTGIPDAEKLDDLQEQWEQYYNKSAEYNEQQDLDGQNQPEFGLINVVAHTSPHIKLVEVPYYETPVMAAVDHPPIHPNVDIIPYKGVNNKVLINLSCNIGEYKAPIMPLLAGDDITTREEGKDWIALMEREYGVDYITALVYILQGKEITFRSDDMASEFEIWRIEKRPESWGDFMTHPSSFVQKIPTNGLGAVSFIDNNLTPNKKYYYTFRTKDAHGHLSNPTPVYRIELVETDGVVYFLMDIVEVKPLEKRRTYKKSGRRYLHVMPVLDQTLINEEKSNLLAKGNEQASSYDPESDYIDASEEFVDPTLGVVSPALFNHDNPRTKFKVRLTSKSTGKKIDFNLKFKVENTKTPITQNSAGDPQEPEADGQESG